MHMYIYVYMYICMYLYTHIYIHICTYVYTYIFMNSRFSTCQNLFTTRLLTFTVYATSLTTLTAELILSVRVSMFEHGDW